MLQHVKTVFIDKYAHNNTASPQTHLAASRTRLFTVKHQLTALTRRWLVDSRLRKYQKVCVNVKKLHPRENVRELRFWVGKIEINISSACFWLNWCIKYCCTCHEKSLLYKYKCDVERNGILQGGVPGAAEAQQMTLRQWIDVRDLYSLPLRAE